MSVLSHRSHREVEVPLPFGQIFSYVSRNSCHGNGKFPEKLLSGGGVIHGGVPQGDRGRCQNMSHVSGCVSLCVCPICVKNCW